MTTIFSFFLVFHDFIVLFSKKNSKLLGWGGYLGVRPKLRILSCFFFFFYEPFPIKIFFWLYIHTGFSYYSLNPLRTIKLKILGVKIFAGQGVNGAQFTEVHWKENFSPKDILRRKKTFDPRSCKNVKPKQKSPKSLFSAPPPICLCN